MDLCLRVQTGTEVYFGDLSSTASGNGTGTVGAAIAYGFIGDPNSPSGTRYYGHLLYGGGY